MNRLNLGDLAPPGTDPAKTAIIDLRIPDTPRNFSYGEIDRMANGVAAMLTARGFSGATRIGILSLNRAEFIATYFGIMRAGLVALPINTKLPDETIDYIMGDAEAALVFADTANVGRVKPGIPVIGFDDEGPDGFTRSPTTSHFTPIAPALDHLAQHLYTSGSTGRPKGVALTHESQLWALRQRWAPDMENERFIVAAPLFHMNGLVSSKMVFSLGASMVMMPGYTPRSYLEAIAAHRVTAITSVPTMLARALKETDLLESLDLSRVKRITMGSAPITMGLWDRVQAAFPDAAIFNSYGTTEAGPAIFGAHPDGLPMPKLSIGYPLPGGNVKLVDGPNENEGVLLMRNPSLMAEYHKLPAQTAKALRDGWYYSGDVMRRDENGFFFFGGRADDMFVCSGENIHPGEVEKMLERHPAIRQASVVPLPDEERGQMPVAFLVTNTPPLPYADIKAFALAHAPAYQHPRRIAYLPELPLAGTNKIDRKSLIAQAAANEAAGRWAE